MLIYLIPWKTWADDGTNGLSIWGDWNIGIYMFISQYISFLSWGNNYKFSKGLKFLLTVFFLSQKWYNLQIVKKKIPLKVNFLS